MNTGHDGSLTTVHSNSPANTLSRIENTVLMAGIEIPLRAIREQMAAAIDLIVHLKRFRDGVRRVVQVTEVQGMEGDTIVMQDIFRFQQKGIRDGHVLGDFAPTGLRPKFSDRLEEAGFVLSPEMFGRAVSKWGRDRRPRLE